MELVNQGNMNPTNKLTAAVAATAFISVARVVVRNLWPEWADDGMFDALTPIVVLAAGWVIRDRANIIVSVENK